MASILDFAAAGLADYTPTLNAAIAAMVSGGDKTLHFPAGAWPFQSQPNPIPYGLHIEGEDIVGTVLRKQFNGGSFFSFTGAAGSGGGMKKATLFADAGFSIGNGILLTGANFAHPEFAAFDDLYITGPGNWNCCVEAYGNNILTPQGIRGVRLSNVHLFNAVAAALWLSNVVDLTMTGGGIYQGSGTAAACGAWVTGGGTQGTNSAQAYFQGVCNNGVLNITNATAVSWMGGEIGSLATDASSHCRIETQCSGTVANNLVSSVVSLT